MWSHVPEVAWAAVPAGLVLVLLCVNLGLTLAHSWQELHGPLWSYFGAITGVAFPDSLGVPAFFAGLTVGLWWRGFAGIGGWVPGVGEVSATAAVAGIGALIGARLADAWFSHIRLARLGFTPNPGLGTARWYLLEAIALVAVFTPGLARHPAAALVGVGASTVFFATVLPIFRLIRTLVPGVRRTPWQAGDPVPGWVQDTAGSYRWLGTGWRKVRTTPVS